MKALSVISLCCASFTIAACKEVPASFNLSEDCELLTVKTFDFTGRLWEYVDAKYDNERVPVYYPDIGEELCIDFSEPRSHQRQNYYSFETDGGRFWFLETNIGPKKLSPGPVRFIRIDALDESDVTYFHLPYSEVHLPDVEVKYQKNELSIIIKRTRDSKVHYTEYEVDCEGESMRMLASGNSPYSMYYLKQNYNYELFDGFRVSETQGYSFTKAIHTHACSYDQN
jgi:hypothetical protein